MADGGHTSATGVLVEGHVEKGSTSAVGVLVEGHVERGEVSSVGVLVDAEPAPAALVSSAGLIVDGLITRRFDGVVSSVGLIVEGYSRDRFDVRAFQALVSDLFDRIRAEEVRVQPLFQAGDVPPNDVRGFVVALKGFRSEIRSLRRTLDARNVLDALVYFDAADAIRLWRWERRTRSALVTVDVQLRRALEVTEDLLEDLPGRTYVTRTGDTLQSVAVRFYGTSEEWRSILAANPGLQAGAIEAGTVITIPEGSP